MSKKAKQDPKAKKKTVSTKRKPKAAISETSKQVAVQAKAGRPSTFVPEVVATILERLAQGESLNAICKDENMPPESTVRSWVLDDIDGIAAKYARARELQAEYWADEIVKLADESRIGIKTKDTAFGTETTTGDMVERTRLQIETRKWLLSKLIPKKYGDKLDVTSDGERLGNTRVIRPASPDG